MSGVCFELASLDNQLSVYEFDICFRTFILVTCWLYKCVCQRRITKHVKRVVAQSSCFDGHLESSDDHASFETLMA